MKILSCSLGVAAALAGCYSDPDDFAIQPSGGPFAVGGTAGGPAVRGRVCLIADLTDLGACATTGAGGLSVALGGEVTTTAPDGTFLLPRPAGSLLRFEVGGAGAVTTTTPYSPSPTIPVVDADAWARLLASNAISIPEGAGSVLGTVVRGGVPATGVTVAPTPIGSAGPFYDDVAGFGGLATGARGVFLVPGVTAGPATSLAFSPGETTVAGVQVVDGGITVLDSVALP